MDVRVPASNLLLGEGRHAVELRAQGPAVLEQEEGAEAGEREQPITPQLADLLAREREMRDDREGWTGIIPMDAHADDFSGLEAWVAERKDVLSGLFFMLTLWCYARYAERPQPASAHVRQRCHHHVEGHLHLPADQIGGHRRSAAIGHMQ